MRRTPRDAGVPPAGRAGVRRDLHARLDKLVAEMVDGGIRMEDAVRQLEAHFLRRVLALHNGNQSRAAAELGVHRNTLRNKLRRCGLL